jgi:teichuronic acid biosynthesis glycosyltransferase TuaC
MISRQTLKILYITNLYPTVETPAASPAVKEQIDMLGKLGVDADLVIIPMGSIFSYFKAALKVIGLNLQKKQFDVLHAFYGYSGFIAKLQWKIPVVTTFVGSDIVYDPTSILAYKDIFIGRWAAWVADAVIVMSEEMKLLSKRSDAHIIPFGIDTTTFAPADQQAAKQKLGLAQDKKYILFPWDPDRKIKRVDIANEALTILQKNHPTAELMCLHNVSHETVADYMNACDAMVLVSDAEGAPVAVREALACNLPVVSVDVGDVKQLLEGVAECHLCLQHPQYVAAKLDIVLRSGRRSNGRVKLSQMDNNWSAQQVMHVYRTLVPEESQKS